jgi:hypothetical protein
MERGSIPADRTDMKELIRTPYKQVFAKIFHTLYEMDKFFKR